MNDIKKSPSDILKSDTELLKHSKYQEHVREMIGFLGFDPNEVLREDTDPNIKIVMKAKALVDKAFNSQMFQRDQITGKYDLLQKITAIAVLTGSLGVKQSLGIPSDTLPYYSAVSEWLDIPEETLRRWWNSQDIIKKEMGTLGYATTIRSAFKQVTLIESITDALTEHADLKKLVKTPAGFNAVGSILPKLVFLMKALSDEAEKLKKLNDDDVILEPTRNIDLVTPEPIIIPKKGEIIDGSITDKEQEISK